MRFFLKKMLKNLTLIFVFTQALNPVFASQQDVDDTPSVSSDESSSESENESDNGLDASENEKYIEENIEFEISRNLKSLPELNNLQTRKAFKNFVILPSHEALQYFEFLSILVRPIAIKLALEVSLFRIKNNNSEAKEKINFLIDKIENLSFFSDYGEELIFSFPKDIKTKFYARYLELGGASQYEQSGSFDFILDASIVNRQPTYPVDVEDKVLTEDLIGYRYLFPKHHRKHFNDLDAIKEFHTKRSFFFSESPINSVHYGAQLLKVMLPKGTKLDGRFNPYGFPDGWWELGLKNFTYTAPITLKFSRFDGSEFSSAQLAQLFYLYGRYSEGLNEHGSYIENHVKKQGDDSLTSYQIEFLQNVWHTLVRRGLEAVDLDPSSYALAADANTHMPRTLGQAVESLIHKSSESNLYLWLYHRFNFKGRELECAKIDIWGNPLEIVDSAACEHHLGGVYYQKVGTADEERCFKFIKSLKLPLEEVERAFCFAEGK